MITLTINADDAADLKRQLAAILGAPTGAAAAALAAEVAAPAAEAKKPTTRKAAEPKAEEAAVEQVQETPAVAEQGAALDFNTDVAPVVVGMVEKFGKPVVVEVFAQFGVAKASEVPAEQWPELITALNDAAETAKPLA